MLFIQSFLFLGSLVFYLDGGQNHINKFPSLSPSVSGRTVLLCKTWRSWMRQNRCCFNSFYGQHQNGYTIIIVNKHTNKQTNKNKVYHSTSVFVGINVVYPKINHHPQKKHRYTRLATSPKSHDLARTLQSCRRHSAWPAPGGWYIETDMRPTIVEYYVTMRLNIMMSLECVYISGISRIHLIYNFQRKRMFIYVWEKIKWHVLKNYPVRFGENTTKATPWMVLVWDDFNNCGCWSWIIPGGERPKIWVRWTWQSKGKDGQSYQAEKTTHPICWLFQAM